MEKDALIYVAGHRGLAGSAILRRLRNEGFQNIIVRSHQDLDLTEQSLTFEFFNDTRPDYVFLAAAKVGGLQANNTYRADFIVNNIEIQTNVLRSACRVGVKKLLFLGSNCAYPRDCLQPMKEEFFLTGLLEPTNQPFAVAKIAGIEMCKAYNTQYGTNFISAIPASLYGPNDNFSMTYSHIVPTLLNRCHKAKVAGEGSVNIPGSPDRIRELLYADDMADACLFLMMNYNSSEIINIGTQQSHTVREIADIVKETVEFEGEITFDTSQSSGMIKKVLDSSKIRSLGWEPKIGLRKGMKLTYEWYLKNSSLIYLAKTE